MSDDLKVRLPLLAVALNLSEQSIKASIDRGTIPRPGYMLDPHGHNVTGKTRAWSLNELRAWRPRVATRCELLLKTLESLPPAA